jgi:hypothetical protein
MRDPADDPTPPAPGADDDCPEVRRLLVVFTDGRLSRAQDRALRLHVTRCAACRDIYRETVASAARLGRALRDARASEERQARRAATRRRVLAVGGERGRFHRLRLALLPAFVIALLVNMTSLQKSERFLTVVREAGTVRVGVDVLTEPFAEQRLHRGDWCFTADGGRARVDGPAATLVLGDHTNLLVEDASVARVRLQTGRLELTGSCVVLCQFGAVRVTDGKASLFLKRGNLEVRCVSGGVAISHAEGTFTLRPGQRARAELAAVHLL